MTLTPEELSERAVKGHITRKLRLSGNELDNYKQLIPHVTKLRESKSLSSIKEMYQNMGMTEKAVSLITKNLKDSDDDDIIDNYDEELEVDEEDDVIIDLTGTKEDDNDEGDDDVDEEEDDSNYGDNGVDDEEEDDI